MNDYRISIEYLTGAEVKRIGHTLRSDPSDTQPGWYVRVTRDAGYKDIVKYTRIAPDAAADIARAIDLALGYSNHTPVSTAVWAGNREHAETRKRRREQAEKQLADAEATLNALDAEEGR